MVSKYQSRLDWWVTFIGCPLNRRDLKVYFLQHDPSHFLGPRGPLRVIPPARPPARKVFILVIKGTAIKHRHKGHRLQRSLRQFLDKNHLLVWIVPIHS